MCRRTEKKRGIQYFSAVEWLRTSDEFFDYEMVCGTPGTALYGSKNMCGSAGVFLEFQFQESVSGRWDKAEDCRQEKGTALN